VVTADDALSVPRSRKRTKTSHGPDRLRQRQKSRPPSARKRLKQLLAELDEIPDSFIADIASEIVLALPYGGECLVRSIERDGVDASRYGLGELDDALRKVLEFRYDVADAIELVESARISERRSDSTGAAE
jgi:hypothetical protein